MSYLQSNWIGYVIENRIYLNCMQHKFVVGIFIGQVYLGFFGFHLSKME